MSKQGLQSAGKDRFHVFINNHQIMIEMDLIFVSHDSSFLALTFLLFALTHSQFTNVSFTRPRTTSKDKLGRIIRRINNSSTAPTEYIRKNRKRRWIPEAIAIVL